MLGHRIGIGVLLLAACDQARPTASSEPSWTARNAAVPEPGPAAVCEPQIPVLEPTATIEVDPFGDTWLRRVHDLVALDASRMLAVGTWGDFFDEGLFVVALEPDGSVAWTSAPMIDDPLLVARIEPLDDGGAWVIAGSTQNARAWRHDADGAELAAGMVDGLWLESWVPTPGGGLWLGGHDGWGPDALPRFAELAADGTVLWQGSDDLAAFDHARAEGVVRRFDAAGALTWEHDPRPEPFAGFPLDIGATWARLHAAGDVAAVGSVVGEAGDATLLSRLDAAGEPRWSQVWPRVRVDASHPRPDGSLLLLGEARECWPQRWLALVDDEGATLVQAQIATSYGVLGLDAADRPVSLRSTGDVLELATYPEVMR